MPESTTRVTTHYPNTFGPAKGRVRTKYRLVMYKELEPSTTKYD